MTVVKARGVRVKSAGGLATIVCSVLALVGLGAPSQAWGVAESDYGPVTDQVISGTLVTEEGDPVPDARVFAAARYGDGDNGEVGSTRSGDDGTFTLRVTTARPYNVAVDAGSAYALAGLVGECAFAPMRHSGFRGATSFAPVDEFRLDIGRASLYDAEADDRVWRNALTAPDDQDCLSVPDAPAISDWSADGDSSSMTVRLSWNGGLPIERIRITTALEANEEASATTYIQPTVDADGQITVPFEQDDDGGRAYNVTVAAENALGWSMESEVRQILSGSRAPGQPRNVSVTSRENGFYVEWEEPVWSGGQEARYEVRYTHGGDPAHTTTEYTDTERWHVAQDLAAGNYSVQVRAYNHGPEGRRYSAPSAEVHVVALGAPGAPDSLAASSASDGRSADLAWSPSEEFGFAVSSYDITVEQAGTSFTWTPDGDGSGRDGEFLTQRITGLTPGEEYTLVIRANSSAGVSPSASTTIVPVGDLPPVSNVIATPGDRMLTVEWDAPSDLVGHGSVSEYRVVATDGGVILAELSTTDTVAEMAIDEAHLGRSHEVAVTAVSLRGEAESVSAHPVLVYGSPTVPREVEVTPLKSGALVSWSASLLSGGADVRYVVTTDPSSTAVEAEESTSVTLSNLDTTKSYSIFVTADNGHFQQTAVVENVRPVGPPSPPTALAADAGDRVVRLTWQPPADDGGEIVTYEVRNVTTGKVYDAVEPRFAVSGLTNGADYAFEVRAVNSRGQSEPATLSGVTPRGVLAGVVALSGQAQVGSSLSVSTSGWPAGTQFNFQWSIEGEGDIAGASSRELLVATPHRNRHLVVTVTATNPAYWPVSVRVTSDLVTEAAAFTFSDVPQGHHFHKAIAWLSQRDITRGFDDGTFRPKKAVTRSAMAAFLYRFADRPLYNAPSRSMFTDMKKGDLFYGAVSWLASTGVTKGYPDGSFQAGRSVSRQAMAAFLYRAAGSPSFTPPSQSPFSDLGPGDKYYKEITWLAATGITTGYSDGEFKPFNAVTRGAMAAFLLRFDRSVGTPEL